MINDEPDARGLVSIALQTFRDSVLPAIPAERRFEALMIANALSIAERELAAVDRGLRLAADGHDRGEDGRDHVGGVEAAAHADFQHQRVGGGAGEGEKGDGGGGFEEAWGDVTARVEHFGWIDDFAAARNHALAQTDAAWRVLLDGDEWVEAGGESIAALRAQLPDHIGLVRVTSRIAADGAEHDAPSWLPRGRVSQ